MAVIIDADGSIIGAGDFEQLTALVVGGEVNGTVQHNSADEMGRMVERHILRHYPQTKQASDTADKMYFETVMRASGAYPSLDADITQAVADYYTAQASGTPKTPAELAGSLAASAGDEVGLEQLIKVSIRIKWVQDCKAAYHAAVADLQAGNSPTLNLPDYPL